jgi:hypothetical protein
MEASAWFTEEKNRYNFRMAALIELLRALAKQHQHSSIENEHYSSSNGLVASPMLTSMLTDKKHQQSRISMEQQNKTPHEYQHNIIEMGSAEEKKLSAQQHRLGGNST